MNKLEIINLSKHYGKKCALSNFSFTFTEGIYGLLGPNGAGKSTLMNLITGNLKPDKDGGKIFWNGEATSVLSGKFRSQLGFMPQQQNLYDNMTAFDFLGYVSALKALDKKSLPKKYMRFLNVWSLRKVPIKKLEDFQEE